MPSPGDRRFTDSHEWLSREGDVITIGITQYAVNELTDITYVELKPAGTMVHVGETLGEVESVKSTSDIYAAIDGEVLEINEAVTADPSLVNSDPFGAGWLVRLRASNPEAIESLLDQPTYDGLHPVE